MRNNNYNFVVYSYCGLLHTTKWDGYIKNPLNDQAKRFFFDKMTHRSKYMISELSVTDREKKIKKYPSYAIQWEGMTTDVGHIIQSVRKVDGGH
jgi:hypothetical protein